MYSGGFLFSEKILYICIYKQKVMEGKIFIKIPKELKDEFKESCKTIGCSMTTALLSMIYDFNKKCKENPKK